MGDLDLTGNGINVVATGSAQTTIDGNGTVTGDRVIDVHAGAIAALIRGINLQNGMATGNGGGIENDAELYLRNDTVSGNSATGDGGGIHYTANGSGDLLNSTVSGNRANGNGGGLTSESSGGPFLNNTTVTQNTADFDTAGGQGGGGLTGLGFGLQLTNSLVAGNTDASGGDAPDCSGTVYVSGYDLFGSGDNCGITPFDPHNGLVGEQVGTNTAPIPAGV